MFSVLLNRQIHGLAEYFESNHIPFSLISAYLAVFAELICGILYIVGLWVKPAALIMVFTFSVAIVFVDFQAGFERGFPAWSIWAVSIFLLLNGAGKISMDEKFLRAADGRKNGQFC